MSRDVSSIIFILAILTYVSQAQRAAFDCKRNGQDCGKGNCKTDGTCDCTNIADTEGYNCGIVKAQKTPGDPRCSCTTDGVCVKLDGQSTTCTCTENFYGSDCSLKRVDVKCMGRKMYLNMNTAGTFGGIAFMKDHRTTQGCEFVSSAAARQTDTNIPATLKGLVLILDLDNTTCGNLTVADNSKEYEAKFYINYNKEFVTSTDEIITAKCVFNDTNTAEGKITGIKVTDDLYKGGSVTGNYDPVVFELKQDSGVAIPAEGLKIGTPLVFTFNIPEKSGFTTLLVKSIKATDTNTKNPSQLQIIVNGCPMKLGSTVIAEPFKLDSTKRTFSGEISLFKFIESTDILFISEVLVCDSTTEAQCAINCTVTAAATTTTVPATAPARKRRAAESVKELTITKTVTISDGSDSNSKQDTNEPVMEDCLQRTEVWVTIVTVSAFLVALLIVCLVLVCRMLTSPKKTKLMSYQNDVANSSLSIPRASVSNF
ncbi:EGF-like domain-containing protein 2 isoform X2 [Gigantopelta aegis]|uniref:EGF-like domain-containing protein 2 isoform X2 n=1 Tax=Gigantopelta aegis TaxID=1735272 RepID=UPI001B88E19F|nr:EGF-like domain-containing protein 2 isoform X2 [Gigantopelta aegis]